MDLSLGRVDDDNRAGIIRVPGLQSGQCLSRVFITSLNFSQSAAKVEKQVLDGLDCAEQNDENSNNSITIRWITKIVGIIEEMFNEHLQICQCCFARPFL